MRASLKLMCFTFWIFSFTFAQDRECHRKDITVENMEPLGQETYAPEEKVRVNCMQGYTGLIRYQCKGGKWELATKQGQCSKKKCGHPEDTPNGDFSLLEGNTEFVFGATVQYTCKKGYEMANRISQRTCRSSGWDNTVPVCEVVKCPPISEDEDLTMSGNTEDGTYNDYVNFECVSPNKKIDREQNHIHCNEKGEWSLPPPKCIEITCTVPEIPHGTVELLKVYKKDDTLQYKCDVGYRPRQGTPRCNTYGWSLKPECEEITCELKEIKYGIKAIEPEGKTFFRAEETVQIICSEKYWIFLTKRSTQTFKCQNDGQWDKNPTCEEIRCEIPRDSRLYSPSYYFYGNMKLDETRSYSCLSRYRQMESVATCTRDGWKPDPLCADVTCEAPNIPNAQIVSPERTNYKINSRIEYKCLPGFEPERLIEITCNSAGRWINEQNCVEKEGSCTTPILENGYIDRDPPTNDTIFYSCNTGYKPLTGEWWGAATCINGRWLNETRCIQDKKCGAVPNVQHGRLTETITGRSAEISCDPGYKSSNKSIKCENGIWETPTCRMDEEGCVSPERVENAVIISKPQERYSAGSHVTYKCHRHFTINGNSDVSCRNSTWDKAPICEAFCSKPLLRVNNCKRIDKTQDERKYSHGDTERYECDDGYESMGETIAKCDGQTWIYPECIRKAQCTKPTKYLQFLTLLDEKNLFNNFETLRYKCNKPYDKIPGGTLTCRDGKWNPTIDCTSSICPPPPDIEDGDIMDKYMTGEVITKVSYSCQLGFVLKEPNRHYRCRDGRWETPPKCLKPCNLTPEIYKDYNIQPIEYNYVKHSDREISFRCNEGWNAGDWKRSDDVKGRCSDGKITIHQKCNTKNWID
ncbi:Complement factor H [Triplophysa tibetana]|uniref:Complement factor H n=1 Tax=Triplophysa tibetana TaxID=1572043 RepID=A0A5A9NS69_9TELE|nr:Complement factor H [Triplophysa tibetana]